MWAFGPQEGHNGVSGKLASHQVLHEVSVMLNLWEPGVTHVCRVAQVVDGEVQREGSSLTSPATVGRRESRLTGSLGPSVHPDGASKGPCVFCLINLKVTC